MGRNIPTTGGLVSIPKTCLDLMDEDHAAYAKILETIHNLKNNGKTMFEKEELLQDAYLLSLKPPMALVETSARMLRLLEKLAVKIHEPLKVDMTVAVESTRACFKGSSKIAAENIKKIQCSDTASSFIKRLNTVVSEFKCIVKTP